MRITAGSTAEFLYFVAVSTSDYATRMTGLTSFSVYASVNGSTGDLLSTAAWTGGEINSTQMAGVYRLKVTDSTVMALGAGIDSREVCLHITNSSGMAPVTRTFELYRRVVTTGVTLTVDSSGAGNADVKEFGGTTVTGRDIGASVLLSSGTGSGQVVLTNGNPTVLLSSGTGTGQVVLTNGNPTVLLSSGTGTGQIVLASGVVSASVASIANNAVTAASIATDAGQEIADAVLDRDMSVGTDTTTFRTPRQALRFLRNKWDVSGTTLTVYEEDDATAAWTAVVTTNASADPITGSDPA